MLMYELHELHILHAEYRLGDKMICMGAWGVTGWLLLLGGDHSVGSAGALQSKLR